MLDGTLSDIRKKLYAQQKGFCFVCGNFMNYMTTQLAHVIPQTKINIKKYGKDVIHNEQNLRLVCSLKCNSSVLIKPFSLHEEKLIKKIKKSLDNV